MSYKDVARSHLLCLLQDGNGLGIAPYRLAGGALGVDLDVVQLLFSLNPQGRLVRVSSSAVTGLRDSRAVLREVNEANDRSHLVKVILRNNGVEVSSVLRVETMTARTLAFACREVARVSAPLGEMLAVVHGGCQLYLRPLGCERDTEEDAA